MFSKPVLNISLSALNFPADFSNITVILSLITFVFITNFTLTLRLASYNLTHDITHCKSVHKFVCKILFSTQELIKSYVFNILSCICQ